MWMKRCRRELMVNRIQLNGAGLNARWERNKANHWLNMQKHLYRISGRLQYISMCSRKMHRLFMNECRLLWLDDISHFTFHLSFIATNICQPFVSMSDIIVYLFVCCWYMWCCWCRCCRVPFFYTHINAYHWCINAWSLTIFAISLCIAHCSIFNFRSHFLLLFRAEQKKSAPTINGVHFVWEVFTSIAARQSFQQNFCSSSNAVWVCVCVWHPCMVSLCLRARVCVKSFY